MIDGIPNRPLYLYQKDIIAWYSKLSNFAMLPDLYLGHASVVRLMQYHFESHVKQIFPKDFASLSPNDTWMFMFEWERVFCPRSLPIQSWKQKTPRERCFNKARKGIWLRLASGMTRLVKQTRNRECRSLANPNITIGHVGGKLQHWHPGYAYICIYIYIHVVCVFIHIPTNSYNHMIWCPICTTCLDMVSYVSFWYQYPIT